MGLNNITHDRCRGPNLARSGGLGWLDVRDGVVCARARRCVCVSGLGRWRQRPSARSHHSTVRCPPFTRRPNDRPEIWRMATECRVRKPSSPPPPNAKKTKNAKKSVHPPLLRCVRRGGLDDEAGAVWGGNDDGTRAKEQKPLTHLWTSGARNGERSSVSVGVCCFLRGGR